MDAGSFIEGRTGNGNTRPQQACYSTGALKMDPNLQLQVSDHYRTVQRIKREIEKMAAIWGRQSLWTVEELEERFEILSCCGEHCGVRDRQTGKMGIVALRRHVPPVFLD